jgi:acetyl esterase/lipase
MTVSDSVSPIARPALDRELAPALSRISAHIPPSLTPDVIGSVRATAGQYEPTDEGLRRDGQVEIHERVVPGPAGEPDVGVLICRPAGGRTPTAGVLYIHGGGMVMGSNRTGIDVLLDWVIQLHVVVVSVDYRLAPENPHPAPVEDSYAALVWVAEHADELGLPEDRLVVAGGSAGGGLAASVALLARDRGGPHLIGQVLMSPMLDDRSELPSTYQLYGEGIWDRTSNLTGWAALLGDRAGGADVSPYAAAARATDLAGLPHTYIDVGSVETLRDESVQYATRIWQAGGSAELHVWSGGFHGFDHLVPTAELSIASRERRIEWLRRLISPENL